MTKHKPKHPLGIGYSDKTPKSQAFLGVLIFLSS